MGAWGAGIFQNDVYDVELPLGDTIPVTFLKLLDTLPGSEEEIENSPFVPQRFVHYLKNVREDKNVRERYCV